MGRNTMRSRILLNDMQAASDELPALRSNIVSSGPVWTTQGSKLSVFHNRAMRVMNPSLLELRQLHIPKRNKDNDDDPSMNQSCLDFTTPYKSDPACRTLRRIKCELYGDEDEEELPAEPTKEEQQRKTAADLVALLDRPGWKAS